jgi:hypothetical protein
MRRDGQATQNHLHLDDVAQLPLLCNPKLPAAAAAVDQEERYPDAVVLTSSGDPDSRQCSIHPLRK